MLIVSMSVTSVLLLVLILRLKGCPEVFLLNCGTGSFWFDSDLMLMQVMPWLVLSTLRTWS